MLHYLLMALSFGAHINISILCKLGIPLLMSVFLYIVYKIPPKDNTQEIELTEKKLKSFGATMVLTGMGSASAWCKKSNPNEVEIRKELRHLANLSPRSAPDPTPDLLAFILMTTGVFLLGINDLFDQIYASFYYEKYCFIKEALKKQITSIKK